MNTPLIWIALVIGAAGSAIGLTAGCLRQVRERETRSDWLAAGFVLLGTIILFLVTLPVEPPVFSLGQRLGYGILVGGLLGVVAGIWSTRTNGLNPWGSVISVAGLSSLALFGASLVIILFRGYPQPALAGFMIGAVSASVIFRLALPKTESMDIWGLSAVALAATLDLAIFRYHSSSERLWWPAPLAIFAVAIVATIATAAFSKKGKGFALPALIGAVLTLALAAVLTWKVFPDWPLLQVAAAGVSTFLLVSLFGPIGNTKASYAAGATLVVVAFSALGFRLMAGFGIGIGMLAGWCILLPAFASSLRAETEEEKQSSVTNTLILAAFIGTGLLLLRLFLETYSTELRGLDIRPHYTLVALTLGAVFPFLLTSFYPVSRPKCAYCAIFIAAMLGILAASSPLLVLLVWGFKPALGFLAGLVIAEVFILFADTGAIAAHGKRYAETAMLVIAAQVSAFSLSGVISPLAQTPRMTRAIILGAVLVIGIIWALISALFARRYSKEG